MRKYLGKLSTINGLLISHVFYHVSDLESGHICHIQFILHEVYYIICWDLASITSIELSVGKEEKGKSLPNSLVATYM